MKTATMRLCGVIAGRTAYAPLLIYTLLLSLSLATAPASAQVDNCPWLPGSDQTDTDGDGIGDACDNCQAVANTSQRDSDADGYGNICDADLNDDGVVNGLDVGPFTDEFGTVGPDADLTGDGVVNGLDVGPFTALFGLAPGPTGMVADLNNLRAVAHAGPDQTVPVSATVHLDGSTATDPDGDRLIYWWAFLATPAGSTATLSDSLAIRPSFVADMPGSYTVQLMVIDGAALSGADVVVIDTVNSMPVAEAGPDQAALISDTVTLDGSGSTDVDGDALTYGWTLTPPGGSAASLLDPLAVRPSFQLDLPGDYVGELTVDDGGMSSDPDQVIVSTGNLPPRADAGPDQGVATSDLVALDGSASDDLEMDPLTYQWALPGQPEASSAALDNTNVAQPNFTADVPGTFVGQLTVNDGTQDSAPETVVVSTDNSRPVADAGADQNGFLSVPVNLDGSASGDADADPLTYRWALLHQPAGSTATLSGAFSDIPSFTPDMNGLYIVQLIVTDGTLASAPDTVVIDVAMGADTDGDGLSDQLELFLGTDVNVADSDTDGLTDGEEVLVQGTDPLDEDSDDDGLTDGDEVNNEGTMPLLPDTDGDGHGDGVELANATDPLDDTNFPTSFPPDPQYVAPAVETGVATTIGDATAFLYTGANPIQTGVAPGTIEPVRAAVLRGAVMDRDGIALSGVTVTILDHPEYGQTLSRADGQFDMAVNGGGPMTVNFTASGFLPAQRTLEVPWQDYVAVDDVALIPLDAQLTVINLTASGMQMAQGSSVTDADGTRRATVLIPDATTAELVMPDGSTQPISNLSIRATEYTVGTNGPTAMPAALPPASGYTYAVELSADEALAAGATQVTFNQPLPVYVDNFLGFPVGGLVPAGFYDRQKAAWVPSENGLVIEIVGETGGKADIDLDGDSIADTGQDLIDLGITDEERENLATLYDPGQSLWRVPIAHFTPWDHNWPYGPPVDAIPPNRPPPRKREENVEDGCEGSGSIIECQNQIVRQEVPITGTPFFLTYRSSDVPGRKTNRRLNISLSGDSVPASLKQIVLETTVAGQVYRQSYPPTTNQSTALSWDGRDAYQREVLGLQAVTGSIGYVYDAVYYEPDDFVQAFGRFGSTPLDGNQTRQEITIRQPIKEALGNFDARSVGLGGWRLDVHQVYDVNAGVLVLGAGSTRGAAVVVQRAVSTVAGDPSTEEGGYNGDGGDANTALLAGPRDVLILPDGRFLIADSQNHRIREVSVDGIITTIAGTGLSESTGDGGPATSAGVRAPVSVAIGPDSSLYIVEFNHRIRKIAPDGIITTIAGNGVEGHSGDGGPAVSAQISYPKGIAVAPDGTIYFVENGTDRIRQISPSGIIDTIAGNGVSLYGGDDGPAIDASLKRPMDVALAPDGSIFIASERRVRVIGTNGIIQTLAGNGDSESSGDGGPASQASLIYPQGLAVGRDALYIADTQAGVVRKVDAEGIITTFAGTFDAEAAFGDGGPPLAAGFYSPEGLSIDSYDRLYIADRGASHIRSVKPVMPTGFSSGEFGIPSSDGTALYQFDATGRHLRTLNTLTGAMRYEFSYTGNGLLSQVEDGDGNITMIERDGSGNPTAIIGPFGQRTELAVNTNGYLSSIGNPANEETRVEYSADGLMTQFIKPAGYVSNYTYDALGRLIRVDDPAGGFQTFVRTELADGYEVARTTALGRTTTYRVERLPTGARRLTNTLPSGAVIQSTKTPDGSEIIQHPDGSTVQHALGPDPRFGMQAPLSSVTVTTPGSLVSETLVGQTAVLGTPGDPLSVQTLTSTMTVNGRTIQSVYDATAMTFSHTTPAGRQASRTIEPSGRLIAQQTMGLESSVITYDGNGRLDSVTYGSGGAARTVSFAYGLDGRLASLTDPLLRTQIFAYDAAGRTVSKTFDDGRSVAFGYDANGKTTSVMPPGRSPHELDHTPLNRVASFAPPKVNGQSATTTYTYDADRALERVTRPDGQTIDYSYDAAGRLMTLFVPSGQYGFTYGAGDQVASITAPDGGVLSYTYDGHLLTELDWSGTIAGTVTRTYDNGFRVTNLAVNGQGISFVYDDDDLVSQAGSMTIQRNAQNGLAEGTTLGLVTGVWTRNSFGEIETYDAEYDGSPVYAVSYIRDALGRITQKVETIDSVQTTFDYDYDDADRLMEVRTDTVVTESYAYDTNGNRLDGPLGTTTYTTDEQDRLLTMVAVAGTTVYGHNNNGERTSKTLGSDITTYAYDVLGNLTSAVLADDTEIEYVVDGRGRRIGKQVDSTLVQGFLYQDGLNPVAELDGTGTVISRFVYAGSANVPAYLVKGGVTYRIIADQIGSPRLVIDVATGAVAQRLDYDSFGTVTFDTNPGFQPFGFAGGLSDTDTGLVRFGFRDYDPEVGRWTTKDPVGFLGGQLNFYTYALNDPVNNVDVSGLAPDIGTGVPELDDLLRGKDVFDNLKKLFGYYEDYKKINEHIDAINDLLEDDSMDSGHRGKEAFHHFLEICKTVNKNLPGKPPIVGDIIEKSFETAEGLLEIGADALDAYAEQRDEAGGFTPVPDTAPEAYPGFTDEDLARDERTSAEITIEMLERMGRNPDL